MLMKFMRKLLTYRQTDRQGKNITCHSTSLAEVTNEALSRMRVSTPLLMIVNLS